MNFSYNSFKKLILVSVTGHMFIFHSSKRNFSL